MSLEVTVVVERHPTVMHLALVFSVHLFVASY